MPTNVKVIALLKASPVTAAEGETLAHLKRFIRGLMKQNLPRFRDLLQDQIFLFPIHCQYLSQISKVFRGGQLLIHVVLP